MKDEQYPLPRVEDVFASLSGGSKFSNIDLTQAYIQMEIDEESKDLLTKTPQRVYFAITVYLSVFPQHQVCGREQWIQCWQTFHTHPVF